MEICGRQKRRCLNILLTCPRPHYVNMCKGMRTSKVRLTANAKVTAVLVLIPASSDNVEPDGWQMKQC